MSDPDSSACISSRDIAVAITDNTKNNFSRVVGLPYFCGGPEKSTLAPHLKCATSASSWIQDLDNRTQGNWDDVGRIELAKAYSLDSAYTHLTHCISKHPGKWEDVKKAFLEVYPEERSLPSLMGELSAVKRQQGETLTELFIRLETLVGKLEKIKPAGKEVYDDMFVSIFLNALPKDFSYILQEADLKKPLIVYKKALKYVASHPHLNLNDAAVRKEIKQTTINAIIETKPAAGAHSLTQKHPPIKNKERCQRCNLTNHTTQNCRAIECFRCHAFGHSSRYCNVRQQASSKFCYVCGVAGHTSKECWYGKHPQKKKRRCAGSSSCGSKWETWSDFCRGMYRE